MTRPAAARLAWPSAVVALALMVASVVLSVSRSDAPVLEAEALVFPAFASFAVVGALIVWSRPDNAVGRLFLWMGFAAGVAFLSDTWANATPPLPWRGWASVLATFAIAFGFVPLMLVLLVFPDGRLLSPRWRVAAWLAVASGALIAIGSALTPALPDFPEVRNPLGVSWIEGTPLEGGGIGWLLSMVGFLVAAVSVAIRYRRSEGEERQRVKWLAVAAGGVGLGWVLQGIAYDIHSGIGSALKLAFFVSVLLFPVAVGFAVLRRRLYDIDVVISRTVVYATLAGFITGVYVAIVVGVGAFVGGRGDRPNAALSIAATALVAVAFQPVRERVRRFANHLVYGKRATPYEVMADFGSRMAGTLALDRALPELAEAAGTGVRGSAARVTLRLPGGERSATWPEGAEPDGWERVVEVRHQGETVGEIAVAKDPGDPLLPAERELLDDLARQAGLALHNVRLNDELQVRLEELEAQAEQLETSRRRLVTARDAQRRGLERDIREGPRRELDRIGEDLERLTDIAAAEPAAAIATLDDVTARANTTLEGLRDLARGIFPPLLAEQGIVAALEAHVRKTSANAAIEADAAVARSRFDPDAEACVYFCCLQAIQNVVRHAGNATAMVRIRVEGAELWFEVADEGPGFDVGRTARGMGLQIMQDRVDALDGTLEIASDPGAGTTVRGRVPARALEAAR